MDLYTRKLLGVSLPFFVLHTCSGKLHSLLQCPYLFEVRDDPGTREEYCSCIHGIGTDSRFCR